MTNHSPADCSSFNLPDLDALARQTGFVARSSGKLSPSTFLQTLCGSVTTGLCSMNQLASSLSDKIPGTLSAQAIHQRFSERSTAFLTAVSHQLLGEEITPGTGAWRGRRIQRILLEDSSVQAMFKSNADHFAAHGNHHGATAGIKIDLAYDMLSGQVVSHDIWAATEQDRTIGRELVSQVGSGDLVVRDMGYFCLAEFTELERLGADWLSRVPLTLGIKTESEKPIETYLRATRSGVVDLKVRAGAEGKLCRLVAVRANRKVTAQRRQERSQEAKKNGGTPGADALLRDGWHLMLTNLESEEFGAKSLRALYRARWGIEIQFRAWKQSQNLARKSHKRRA